MGASRARGAVRSFFPKLESKLKSTAARLVVMGTLKDMVENCNKMSFSVAAEGRIFLLVDLVRPSS